MSSYVLFYILSQSGEPCIVGEKACEVSLISQIDGSVLNTLLIMVLIWLHYGNRGLSF